MSHPAWLDGPHWTHVPASDDTPAYNLYTGPLPQPVTDKRAQRLLRLANGLQVVLVHDPKTDKAAVSMHVAVGYMNAPVSVPLFWRSCFWAVLMHGGWNKDDMPGMAHLCGRMIMKVIPTNHGPHVMASNRDQAVSRDPPLAAPKLTGTRYALYTPPYLRNP